MTYSLDFRKKVLQVKAEEGLSFELVSSRFGVGKASVMRWSKELYAKKTRNKSPVKIANDVLLRDVELHPDSYQYERAARLGVSQVGIHLALKRLKMTYKKNLEPSEG